MIFDGKPISAPPDQMPPGYKKKNQKTASNQYYMAATAEVWLCDVSKKEPKKIRKLHVAVGATCKAQCADFIKLWREDAPVQPPPQCAADVKKLKPPAEHDELDLGDAQIV